MAEQAGRERSIPAGSGALLSEYCPDFWAPPLLPVGNTGFGPVTCGERQQLRKVERMADAEGSARRRGRFEELSIQECRELLGTTTIGRVGFASSTGQLILPVNFSFVGGAVIFRTAATGPLGELASGADDVAFEVDYHGTRSRRGWSVLLNGPAAVVDADEVPIPTGDPAQHVAPWAEGQRELIIRLLPRTITGRRVSRPD
jgi:hypothetical protein